MTRRRLLKLSGGAAAGWSAARWMAACRRDETESPPERAPSFCQSMGNDRTATVAAARGTDLQAMTRQVLAGLGGIRSFVRAGESMGAVCESAIELVGARLTDLRVRWQPAVPAT